MRSSTPHASHLKEPPAPGPAVETQQMTQAFRGKLARLRDKPPALTRVASGSLSDPLERECVRASEKEQEENGLNHNNFIKQSFLVIFFGNVELKIDLQSKWA